LAVVLLGGPVGPAGSLAQTPAPATAPPEEGGQHVADLTTRYRFLERYATAANPTDPRALVQTRVGILETIKTEIDNPRGAPDRRQVEAQTNYTERTVEVGADGDVVSAVRRYDLFRLRPDPASKPGDPRPLEGLSVWYQRQPTANPLVLSLTENRGLREMEFAIISRQVFLPMLVGILPPQPSRIGDRWPVQRTATRALLGPQAPADEVVLANFKDLRTAPKGTDLVAIFGLTARSTSFQAEVQFTFARTTPPADDSQGSTVEARGAITEIRSAQSQVTPLPDSNGRLRQTQTRELILALKRDDGDLLALPAAKPAPTEANSWLTYVDPRRRFHFRHPQALQDDSPPGADSVELVHFRSDGVDVLGVQIQPKTGDAEADRRNLDPEFHRKTLAEVWRQEHQDVVSGSHGWLPEADWKAAGLRVYRIEAALQLVAGRGAPVARRVHLDYYLILTNRPESLVVTARTDQDPPVGFRKEGEAVIKTFRFGLPEKN
jgi:hypothetical protein